MIVMEKVTPRVCEGGEPFIYATHFNFLAPEDMKPTEILLRPMSQFRDQKMSGLWNIDIMDRQ